MAIDVKPAPGELRIVRALINTRALAAKTDRLASHRRWLTGWQRRQSACPARSLTVVTSQDTSDRQILVEIWPMQAERENLDVIQLVRRHASQSLVAPNRKGDL